MGHVAQAEGDHAAIEVGIGKGQPLGIAADHRAGPSVIEQTVAADGQHRRVDVGEPDLAGGAHATGELPGEVGGAAGDIEHPHAGAHRGVRHGGSLPDPVQPDRHQVVHGVVARGHGVEDPAYPFGLAGRIDRLETEMRGRFRPGGRGTLI